MNLQRAVAEKIGRPVAALQPVGGGCIARSYIAHFYDSTRLFVKSYRDGPAGIAEAEASGLKALADTGTVKVPELIDCGETFLILEYVESHEPSLVAWERLGRSLAELHRVTEAFFGFSRDNYIGRTPQINDWEGSGPGFYRNKRFLPLISALNKKGALAGEARVFDRFLDGLDRWLPEERPSLLHGDLWSGNAIIGPKDEAYLIDPAVYYGYREADLAMSQLFGGFDRCFFAAYHRAYPVDAGYKVRKDLFNLYHILNHALIFGGGYLSQAIAIAKQFVG